VQGTDSEGASLSLAALAFRVNLGFKLQGRTEIIMIACTVRREAPVQSSPTRRSAARRPSPTRGFRVTRAVCSSVYHVSSPARTVTACHRDILLLTRKHIQVQLSLARHHESVTVTCRARSSAGDRDRDSMI
jgi:hypothetical protein